MLPGGFGVIINVIVFGWPAVPWTSDQIIADDLVQEVLPPKDIVQHDFAIMRFAVIDVKVQAAVVFQYPMSLFEARANKSLKIME